MYGNKQTEAGILDRMTISHAIELFLTDAATGSRHTRRTYRTALNQFQEYLSYLEAGADATDLKILDVDLLLNFATWLIDIRAIHKRTLQTYMSALMSFVRFLQIRDRLPLTASEMARLEEGVRRLRLNQRPPDLIPHPPREKELRALVYAAKSAEPKHRAERDQLIKLRNIAIIETLMSTGLRVGELVKICKKQLNPEEHSVWITGKGDRMRKVHFSKPAWQSTQQYLAARHNRDMAMADAAGNLPLFSRHDRRAGNRILSLNTASVQNIIRDLAFQARLGDRGITPHALRHYFGTRMYRATHDLAVTQTAMGHASPQTTRIYVRLQDNALKKAHDKAFAAEPEDGARASTRADTSTARSTS